MDKQKIVGRILYMLTEPESSPQPLKHKYWRAGIYICENKGLYYNRIEVELIMPIHASHPYLGKVNKKSFAKQYNNHQEKQSSTRNITTSPIQEPVKQNIKTLRWQQYKKELNVYK